MRAPRGVMEVLDWQRDALAAVAPGSVARLLGIAADVRRELEERLVALAPERYTTQETRVLLAQARAVVEGLGARFGVEVGDALEDLGRSAAGIGRETLLREIDAWGAHFRGTVRRTAPVELAGDLLGDGLLEYYDVSRDTYGLEAIRSMRGVLARSVIEGDSVFVTASKLRDAVPMERHRAERIVRTEQSFASHARQFGDLEAMYGEGAPGWKKALSAVRDNRTGEDSIFVDGQTRAIGVPFEDNLGHVYQHPPNRPNDREVVLFVPDDEEAVERVAGGGGSVVDELPDAAADAPTLRSRRGADREDEEMAPQVDRGRVDVDEATGLARLGARDVHPRAPVPDPSNTGLPFDADRAAAALRTLADSEWNDDGASGVNAARELRAELNSLVQSFGMTHPAERLGKSSSVRIMPESDPGAGMMYDDGSMWLKRDVVRDAPYWLDGEPWAVHKFATVVHETIHAHAHLGEVAFEAAGVLTEIAAEYATRRVVLSMRPWLDPVQFRVIRQRHGGYRDLTSGFLRDLRLALEVSGAKLSHEGIETWIEDAAVRYHQASSVVIGSEDEAGALFVDAFDLSVVPADKRGGLRLQLLAIVSTLAM